MAAATRTMPPARRRRGLLGGLAAIVTACLLFTAGPAALAADEASLSVRRVDATDPDAVAVDLIWTGDRAELDKATIREDGQNRPIATLEPLRNAGVVPGVVVVVDTSRSMAGNGGVRMTQETLRSMIGDLDDGEPMGIVAFDTEVEVLADLTTDRSKLNEAADALVAPETGKTAMWDAVRKAASMFRAGGDVQPNIILITDGYDDASDIGVSRAASEVARVGGAVFALAYGAQNQVDVDSLEKLVSRVGGAVLEAPGEEDLADGLVRVQHSLDDQYRLTFESHAEQGGTDLAVSVGGETVKTTFVAGAVASGKANLEPPASSRSLLPSFVRGDLGMIAVVAAGGLAIALAVVALIMFVSRDEQDLDKMLQQYTEPGVAEEEEHEGLVQTAFVQRAVDLTEEIATRQGILVKIEGKLEQADLPLRAAEALFFYVITAVLVTLVGLVLGGLFGLVMGALIGFLLPMAILNFLGGRRRKAFESQLPDMLNLLAGSLRAGYSLVQGVEAVSTEVDGPMGRELRRVMTEARLGRELEEALQGAADRVQSKDFEWAIMAIRIQREVGGNLSELLQTVAETMINRERLRRDVNSLTAEGKISAIVLGGLPALLGMVMYAMNPDYMTLLFTTGTGQGMLVAGTISALIGFAWMKKCISIEI